VVWIEQEDVFEQKKLTRGGGRVVGGVRPTKKKADLSL